jgi:K+-transporting ATPase, KdpF subunit
MSISFTLALIVAIGLLAYLCYALGRPEKF